MRNQLRCVNRWAYKTKPRVKRGSVAKLQASTPNSAYRRGAGALHSTGSKPPFPPQVDIVKHFFTAASWGTFVRPLRVRGKRSPESVRTPHPIADDRSASLLPVWGVRGALPAVPKPLQVAMAKQNWKTRLKAQNIEELKALKTKYPEIEILEFSPLHLRLIGIRRVDFWPSTGRGWLVGQWRGSKIMTPAQAVALAFDHLSDAARSIHNTEFREIIG
jgi:hypothetical protein